MKSICLILPWFGGPFKNYFHLFLESCKNNPTINWLIFTDSTQSYNYPENVKIVKCSFEYVRERIQKIFDFEISLNRPYKLCDFKPTYGEVFHEELKHYDYWGYCDCDLIFGNIRSFVTDEILEKYDKIFSRGHLTIYRNINEVNSFYKTVQYPFYKDVFSSSKSFAFDEWGGVSAAWSDTGKLYYDNLVMDDIRVGFKKFRITKEISGFGSPYHNNINESKKFKRMKDIFYVYDKGKLYRRWMVCGNSQEEEVLYVHFQKRAMGVVGTHFEKELYFIVNNFFCDEFDALEYNLKKIHKFCLHDILLDFKFLAVKLFRTFVN